MPAPHRIFGSELSPYSVKVRSYFRYKGIPHEWLERGPSNIAEYQKHAKLPLIPLVITPEGVATAGISGSFANFWYSACVLASREIHSCGIPL